MRKIVVPGINLLTAVASNYPRVPKFFRDGLAIPIQSHFHKKLFPEASSIAHGQTPDLFEISWRSGDAERVAPASSVRKAYLSNAPKNEIEPGTPLIFYLSKDEALRYSQRITAFGISEQYMSATDVETVMKVVRLRTVYSTEEIRRMLQQKLELKVLKFLFVGYFKEPPTIQEMIDREILKSHPQSFTRVDGRRLSNLVEEIGLSHIPNI